MGHRRQLTARALREALGGGARVVTSGTSLEVSLPSPEGARTLASSLLRDRAMSVHVLPSASEGAAAFAAFLDGVQESRVVAYLGTIPIVYARTGAVVRARVDRRLVTWGDGPLTDDALYLPMHAIAPAVLDSLAATGCPLVDTTDSAAESPAEAQHPQQLLRRAVHLVQRGREALECALADAWCGGDGTGALYVDGGLPPSDVVLRSGRAVGVIKSHHTLYATGSDLAVVMSLGARERSSVFVVETRWREPVASWYLRVRAPGTHDPLWGLVRVECSLDHLEQQGDDAERAADTVSAGVAAEAAPLSLPDARWDTMAYGIRDCEVYLRATLGRLAT